jgi:hypothetical protein
MGRIASASITAVLVPITAALLLGFNRHTNEGSTMKTLFIAVAVIAFSGSAAATGSHHVSGYVKRDGTYVAPHEASNPNAYRYDNRSSQTNGGSHRDEYSTPAATNRSNPSWGSADNDNDGVPNSSDSTPDNK